MYISIFDMSFSWSLATKHIHIKIGLTDLPFGINVLAIMVIERKHFMKSNTNFGFNSNANEGLFSLKDFI